MAEQEINRVERNDGLGLEPTKKDLEAPGKELDKGILEKNNAYDTKKNSPSSAASKIVDLAKDKGWDNIKVQGTPEFKSQVWEKAAEQGLKVQGYEPSNQQKTNLANKVMAKEFVDDPAKAIKKHPELKDAKEILDAISKKVKQDGLDKKQQKYVNDRAMGNVVKAIEAGKAPKLQEREKEIELQR